jgi:hypothetical protein
MGREGIMLKDYFSTKVINGVEVVSEAEMRKRGFMEGDILSSGVDLHPYYTESQILRICNRLILTDAITRFAVTYNLTVDELIIETWRGLDYVSTAIFHDRSSKLGSRLTMFLLYETFASQYIKAPYSFRDELGTLFISSWAIDALISLDEVIRQESLAKITQRTYVMYDSASNLYKIGRSKDISVREKAIRSAAPNSKMILVCENDIESELHNEYAIRRRHGEWFALSANDVLDLIKKYGFKRLDK